MPLGRLMCSGTQLNFFCFYFPFGGLLWGTKQRHPTTVPSSWQDKPSSLPYAKTRTETSQINRGLCGRIAWTKSWTLSPPRTTGKGYQKSLVLANKIAKTEGLTLALHSSPRVCHVRVVTSGRQRSETLSIESKMSVIRNKWTRRRLLGNCVYQIVSDQEQRQLRFCQCRIRTLSLPHLPLNRTIFIDEICTLNKSKLKERFQG